MSTLPGVDLAALQRHLEQQGLDVAGPLSGAPLGGGRSNLTALVEDGVHSWVLRRPPVSGLTESAHDVAREWRVCQALQGSAVPVPPTVLLCEDPSVLGAPFAVTGWISGSVIRRREDLQRFGDAELAGATTALVRVLAALHQVDVQQVGLGGFGRPEGFVPRQVQLWWRQWGQVKGRELADVDRLFRGLERACPPGQGRVGIIHGDFRIDNTIVAPDDPAQIRAVVDWELSTVGDVQTDLALMCVYRHPALDVILGHPAAWASPRLPSPDTIAQTYVEHTGHDLAHWPFYLALAAFKLAVIAEGISYRARQGAAADATAAAAAQAVPELIGLGLSELARLGQVA